MRRDSILVGLMGLLVLALTLPARADMAESLRREFHAWSELGITVLADSNSENLDAILRSGQTRVLVLQTSPEKLEAAQARKILDWVRTGRSVWFYDARLAPYFGMRPFMLKPDQFRGRPENGQLGDKVHPGMATVVLATGSHEVLTGVGQATIWLPELEPGTYGAVAVEGDTVPLLHFMSDSPALAALRRDGRGLVVFKPLLWVKPLSGERFQSNLMEFSAGFPVPGSGGEGRLGVPPGPEAPWVEGRPAIVTPGEGSVVLAAPLPAAQHQPPAGDRDPQDSPSQVPSPQADPGLSDRVEIKGEGLLTGRILNREFCFETSSESLKLPRESIRWIQVGASSLDLDRLETRDGRTLAGIWMDDKVQIELPSGVRAVGKRQISRLEIERQP